MKDQTNNATTTTEEEEKKIVRALDRHLMPLFCVFYFTDYLDRANIGNASLAGIEEDLNLSATQLSTAISAFYITYILFEVPSNMILKQTSATIWLSSIMLCWGVITLVMGFVTSFGGLLAARLLLGIAESGYIPGILYQMSRVYQARELGIRISILLCMSAMSGILSGPLAYGTSFLEGRNNMHGWQYLFILEGVPTIALSVVSYLLLFDNVDEVKWLTPAQKQLQHCRMQAQQLMDSTASSSLPEEENRDTEKKEQDGRLHSGGTSCDGKKTTTGQWVALYKAFTDWKMWLFALVYMLHVVNFSSFSIFSPVIIDGFGFSVLTSQLLAAPPNIIAVTVVLFSGYLIDRYDNCRAKLLVASALILTVGYTMMLVLQQRWALYGSLFVIPAGLGLQGPAVVGWSAVNFPDLSVRAVAVALVVMIGNSGGVIASYLYPSTNAPHYYFGNGFNLICAILTGLVSGLTGYLLSRENKRREELWQAMMSKEKQQQQLQAFGSESCIIEKLSSPRWEEMKYRLYY
ncbi:major facilitator superfamily domain-containing protein [Zychaea mexicana]|uniref:major facilitator superfamily domain-containing protein n=1 Tax=Zychaea mexicana TaxID=64656 RepID=UPI0022FE91EC|nr:major facilitator superfamily domain-containing protein [Zychaea mexicana]KAI9498837.1 major facilitator superfamily domain-containing protein [Zychaea mexicana]